MLDTGEEKKNIKHFTDLDVWRKSHALFLDLLNDLESVPKTKAGFVIMDQIIRSVGSISANIAEGFNARTTNHYISFLDIAKRTSAESENWFYKLQDTGYLKKETADQHIQTCLQISRMLSGLIRSLEKRRK
jgi:four helix bundle protein